MPKTATFTSNWSSAPGETILDILTRKDISLDEFASLLHQPLAFVRSLIEGSLQIDQELAALLSRNLGSSTEFWLAREQQYREDLSRLDQETIEAKEWTEQLPIKDMISFGWIKEKKNFKELLEECLNFFGVNSIAEWTERYSLSLANARFRKSQSFSTSLGATTAWVRQGEILGSNQNITHSWDPERFSLVIARIRRLTRKKDPNLFLPELKAACHSCGVALVVLRTPNGCPASGAAKFISPHRALIILSFRYLSDDHFWFSFFHEAGHILLHNSEKIYIENQKSYESSITAAAEEDEANCFARDMLIPEDLQAELVDLRLTTKEILRFARKAGVSPGIIVGQLQFLGRVPPSRFNTLKRRFSWEEMAPIL